MNIIVEPKLKELFRQHKILFFEDEDILLKKENVLYVGSYEWLFSKITTSEKKEAAILIDSIQSEEVLIENISNLTRFKIKKILNDKQIDEINDILSKLKVEFDHYDKIKEAKTEVQNKRKQLEILNYQLNIESEQQMVTLEKAHEEESEKNNSEKSLLHFLDFVQSESLGEDFLDYLIKFIWKDLKKIGRVYQIGFSFLTYSDKSNIYAYNGLAQYNSFTSVDFDETKPLEVANQMAKLWGRPIGKLLICSLPDFSRKSYFFVEIIDQNISIPVVENYIKERLAVLSLYLDRWMIEKEFEMIIDRWNRTFKSFSGYVHVVDENYNIYQSNYSVLDDSDTSKKAESKCYQKLALKDAPCVDCPISEVNKSKDFLLKPGIRVKTHLSEFNYNQKKYFFVIYEDITQMHLLKSQMIHSEKMSALGRLGNHLAHELNNPLTGIKSYVQSLLEDGQTSLNPTIKSDLGEILKATIRSQKIIQNFIQFSNHAAPHLEKVVFLDVLNNALTLLKSVLRPHRLFVDIKQTEIVANSHDLQQVLFNLIKNSCQAMQGAGTLKIYEIYDGNKVGFIIEDSGPGFNSEILNHLFEPFMTTKKKGEGTGLGLYLSKKLMNNMNADLEIQNVNDKIENKGARMKLIFEKI